MIENTKTIIFENQNTGEIAKFESPNETPSAIANLEKDINWAKITLERYYELRPNERPLTDEEKLQKEELFKQEQQKQSRISYLETEMDELRKDFAQDIAGRQVDNLQEKKNLYNRDYEELCELKGITPKPMKI